MHWMHLFWHEMREKLLSSITSVAVCNSPVAHAFLLLPAQLSDMAVLVCTGRVHMAVPVSGMTPARRERNGNKHKRLFMGGPGGLTVRFLYLHACLMR